MLDVKKSIFAEAPVAPEPITKPIKKVTKTLEEGRARIAPPYGWIQHRLHAVVPYEGKYVEAYCMLGAVFGDADAYELLQKCLPAGHTSVPKFNDLAWTTKEEVLAVFDRAIALSKIV